MKKLIICNAILVSCLLTGCATGYHPNGLSGGFEEFRLSSDSYSVSFSGNGYMDLSKAQEYALRRASEITLKNGYKYFILKRKSNSVSRSAYTTPVQSTTTSNYNAHAFGNFGNVNGQSNTTITGGNTVITEKPYTSIIIQMLNINQPGAYDAEIILSNYAPKIKNKSAQ